MGNVKSCCGSICSSSKDDDDEYGEQTRILGDPTDSSVCDDLYTGDRITADTQDGHLHNTLDCTRNNILMRLAENLIDVGSSYVPNIESSDVTERQRLYANRLAQVKTVFTLRSRQVRNKRSSTKNKSESIDYRKLLHAEPIPEEDVRLVKDFAKQASDAFQSGFNIQLDEPLVVQFNP